MKEIDKLVMTDLMAFRQQALESIQQCHPHIFFLANALLSGKKNRLGLEVTIGGKSIGQYTLHLDGLRICHVESEKLDPHIDHPILGTIRLYAIIEQAALEQALSDTELLKEPFNTIGKYLPEITIKFLP